MIIVAVCASLVIIGVIIGVTVHLTHNKQEKDHPQSKEEEAKPERR